MNTDEQVVVVAEGCGWGILEHDLFPDESPFKWIVLGPSDRPSRAFVMADENLTSYLPKYETCLNNLAEARNTLVNTPERRIKWVNTLRDVVGRESPRNKSGTPMVSDIDLLFARPDQLLETLVRTINKWKK